MYYFLSTFRIYIYNKFGINGEYIQRNFFSLIFYWYISSASYEFFILSNKKIKSINLFFLFVTYLIISNLYYVSGLHYIYSIVLAIISAIFIAFIYQSNSFQFSKVTHFSKLINLLGESAYSIYAWHIIVLFCFNQCFGNLSSYLYIICILSTMVISILSYFSIEKYFIGLRKKIIS